ncbi:hypothetical protein LTR44_009474 [Exophiala sp. CCFEE 6388]|nr:hypothetical protein LTR44_009474 [Eurotiomycetes sp. CCFEE 6388]
MSNAAAGFLLGWIRERLFGWFTMLQLMDCFVDFLNTTMEGRTVEKLKKRSAMRRMSDQMSAHCFDEAFLHSLELRQSQAKKGMGKPRCATTTRPSVVNVWIVYLGDRGVNCR